MRHPRHSIHCRLATDSTPIVRRGLGGPPRPSPRKLQGLGFTLVQPTSVATPTGAQKANLNAPKKWCVAPLAEHDYIAATDLRSCTALAVYDPQTDIGGMYHFGGQFGDEHAELGAFFLQMTHDGALLSRLVIFLSGSEKCAHAQKVVAFLNTNGMNQTPTISEGAVSGNGATTFYLLARGEVANTLT